MFPFTGRLVAQHAALGCGHFEDYGRWWRMGVARLSVTATDCLLSWLSTADYVRESVLAAFPPQSKPRTFMLVLVRVSVSVRARFVNARSLAARRFLICLPARLCINNAPRARVEPGRPGFGLRRLEVFFDTADEFALLAVPRQTSTRDCGTSQPKTGGNFVTICPLHFTQPHLVAPDQGTLVSPLDFTSTLRFGLSIMHQLRSITRFQLLSTQLVVH